MFKIVINTDSAAFYDGNFNETPQAEISRIVKVVMAQMESGATNGICRDNNGNIVGKWSLSSV